MRDEQPWACHSAAFLVDGHGISRNPYVARCHRAGDFLSGGLPHFSGYDSAAAVL